MTTVSGVAAGVPYVLQRGSKPDAPVIVAWHLLDSPRTEAALAAALPLDGLDAWRVYFGLPMCGSRSPAGGFDTLMKLAMEDAVMNLHGPISEQAASEFGPALEELRGKFGFRGGPLGVMGGSLGSAIALDVLARRSAEISAAVLISPMVRLHDAVEALSKLFGASYTWSDPSRAIARRMDFVARASELAANEPAIRIVLGSDDNAEGFLAPARALHSTLTQKYRRSDRIDLVTVEGLGHALAEEPGMAPAPQLPNAAKVDRLAVEWFQKFLR